MKDYTGYSGDAIGSDKFWAEIGRQYGIGKQVNYLATHMDKLTPIQIREVELAYQEAANDLGRFILNSNTYAGKLVRRDYLQAKAGHAIFAIGRIVKPGDKSSKGQIIRSKTESIDGGTGYCVQMAINLGKPVFVFDQEQDRWFEWNYDGKYFQVMDIIPILTKKYTGVGTRKLNKTGERAIIDIFEYTKAQQQNINNHVDFTNRH